MANKLPQFKAKQEKSITNALAYLSYSLSAFECHCKTIKIISIANLTLQTVNNRMRGASFISPITQCAGIGTTISMCGWIHLWKRSVSFLNQSRHNCNMFANAKRDTACVCVCVEKRDKKIHANWGNTIKFYYRPSK